MSWWVYKCNSRQQDYQNASGDWDSFFKHPEEEWGSTEWVPQLANLKRGDHIICYQTYRNELVGTATVRQACEIDSYLYLDPVERVGVKVRPLKQNDPIIAAIPALAPGPIKTIYEISDSDAYRLLKAAGANYVRENEAISVDELSSDNKSDAVEDEYTRRGWFGTADNNAVVEALAIDFVTERYRQDGFEVESVEQDKCGFDLRCKKGELLLAVEVKGVSGTREAFIITAGEVSRAKNSPNFVLCVVTSATTNARKLSSYAGAEFLEKFLLEPTQFRATHSKERTQT